MFGIIVTLFTQFIISIKKSLYEELLALILCLVVAFVLGEALKTPPSVGDYVAMKCCKGNIPIYYRAEVEKVNPENGECTLFKVDCGTRCTSAITNLYHLPRSLLQVS